MRLVELWQRQDDLLAVACAAHERRVCGEIFNLVCCGVAEIVLDGAVQDILHWGCHSVQRAADVRVVPKLMVAVDVVVGPEDLAHRRGVGVAELIDEDVAGETYTVLAAYCALGEKEDEMQVVECDRVTVGVGDREDVLRSVDAAHRECRHE